MASALDDDLEHSSTPLLHHATPRVLSSNSSSSSSPNNSVVNEMFVGFSSPPPFTPKSPTRVTTPVALYSDTDSIFQDVCVPSQLAHTKRTSSIDFNALNVYRTKARRSPAPPPVAQCSVRNGIQKSLVQLLHHSKLPVRQSTTACRIVFFSLDDGVVVSSSLQDLVLGLPCTTPHSPADPTVNKIPPLHELLVKHGTWWIDVECPSVEEIQVLARIFFIHPLTVEDIIQGRDSPQETREKVELFSAYYWIVGTLIFTCFHLTFDEITPFNDCLLVKTFDSNLVPFNFYLIVFGTGLLTLHYQPTLHAVSVIKRISQLVDYGFRLTPSWICYALIDDITDSYSPVIRSIEREVEEIDDLVLVLHAVPTEQADMLRRIGRARKQVMLMLRLLSTKADVVKTLIKRVGRDKAGGPDTPLYLGDIQDHLLTMLQNLQFYDKTLARAHSNYLASITIKITQSNEHMNNVMAKLTIVATIMVPLNVITGLWGMNVKVPGQDMDSEHWFYMILTAMGGFVVSVFAVARYGGLL